MKRVTKYSLITVILAVLFGGVFHVGVITGYGMGTMHSALLGAGSMGAHSANTSLLALITIKNNKTETIVPILEKRIELGLRNYYQLRDESPEAFVTPPFGATNFFQLSTHSPNVSGIGQYLSTEADPSLVKNSEVLTRVMSEWRSSN